MVDIQQHADTLQCRFILRPNRSLSWRGSLLFYFSLIIISSAIAIGLTLLGFWLVLPFAGLEMLALGIGLYVVACRCYECEVISINDDSIRIERGRDYPREQWTLGRMWVRVVLERCPRAWYPSRLLIRSHGRSVEVGRFLDEEERRHLANELTRSLRPAISGNL
ncbi:MAG: DUF2244 domain-containing protein [Candidatus Competibacteraceae bacterium]